MAKRKRKEESVPENTPNTIEEQQSTGSEHPADMLTTPIERLKRLSGTITILASLGSPERECLDSGEHILRFCEPIEDHLITSLDELVAVQRALD